jgi:hypothetical protein
MIGVEPVEPRFEEALLPADDGGSHGLQPALNGIEGDSFSSIKMSLARET